MVNKKSKVKSKGSKKAKKEESEESEGVSLDDAFAGDEDVEYAKPKPKKIKKVSDKELEDELEDAEESAEDIAKGINGNAEQGAIAIKASKPVSKIKKGDKITVDGQEYEVDQHYVLIDHGTTKEMAIELFDSKTDKDYQLRYFNDQAESTMEFYELQEIMFIKRAVQTIEW